MCFLSRSCRRQSVASAALLAGLLALPLHALASGAGSNGHIAYTGLLDGSEAVFLLDSGPLTFPDLGPPRDHHRQVAWSPDGTQIAYARYDGALDDHFIEIRSADGSEPRTVVSSDAFAEVSTVASPTWSSDGQWIAFVATHPSNGNLMGIWRIRPNGTGLTKVANRLVVDPTTGTLHDTRADHPDWSPRGNEIAYRCAFRGGYSIEDLCIVHAITREVTRIPLEVPFRWASGMGRPKWLPDGQRIAFTVQTGGLFAEQPVSRTEIYTINADGSDLRQVTVDSPAEICAGSTAAGIAKVRYADLAPSPDGEWIAAWAARATAGEQTNGHCPYSFDGYLSMIRVADGRATEYRPGPHREPAWQPIPAKVTVRVDDGRGHPLKGLKVELLDPENDANVLYADPVNRFGGSYAFTDVLPGDYTLKVTLVDHTDFPPSFDIRHQEDRHEPVWVMRRLKVTPEATVVTDLHFEDHADLLGSNPSNSLEHLADMAHIYYQMRRFVDWVKANLTMVTGDTVKYHTFAETDPTTGSPVGANDAYHRASRSEVVLGTDFSRYEARDGVGAEAPENGEWHEFVHHLWATFIVPDDPFCSGSNHLGYNNPDTCDSMKEGLASFLPTIAAHAIDGASDSFYDGMFDLEDNVKAWGFRGRQTDGQVVNTEVRAVAALLWDLLDDNADSEATEVIGEDGLHWPVVYTDQVSFDLADIWERLVSNRVRTVYDLRSAFGNPALTLDLDGDGIADIAPIDQVFLMHGFFPVDGDQIIGGDHGSYHYDVGAAQREDPGAARNAHVGRTDHRVLSAAGSEEDALVPRAKVPRVPGASLAIDVRDVGGTPLSGATIGLAIEQPGLKGSSTRRLGSGDGALLYLELPPFFDYLLPDDAPLPPCDPATAGVKVTLTATVNGYVSDDSPVFDNCTYLQAVDELSGPAALAFHMEFPQDSLPPVTTTNSFASPPAVDGVTTGSWTVGLVCADPAEGGFASGCARIDYSLDGGPVTTYQRPIIIEGIGQHTLDYRSVDGAGNEESFGQVTLAIAAAPPPTISSFSPASGTVGTVVTIDGTHLEGATEVTIGGAIASYTVMSQTRITATVPAGADSGLITITTLGGTASSLAIFTLIRPPLIHGFDPLMGTVGTAVTISGEHFVGTTQVAFQGVNAPFNVASATEIVALVPVGATSGPISVTTPGGTATSAAGFMVTTGVPPSISSFSPTIGAPGTAVTIKGANFSGATAVSFHGASATFKRKGSSQITATVPAGATTGPISVTTPGGIATTETSFVVPLPPTVDGFAPESGAGGTLVTITGTHLEGATRVRFGGSTARFTVVSATEITATVPKGAKSGPISVTTPGGNATSAGNFTVTK